LVLESDQSLNFSKNFQLFERKRYIKGFEISSYFAATAKWSNGLISARSETQKINNISKDESAPKYEQSQKKNLEVTVKKSQKVRKKSFDTEVTLKKSAKKSSNLDKDTPIGTREDQHWDSIPMAKVKTSEFIQFNILITPENMLPPEKRPKKLPRSDSPKTYSIAISKLSKRSRNYLSPQVKTLRTIQKNQIVPLVRNQIPIIQNEEKERRKI